MSEPSPVSPEKTVVVNNTPLCRLWILTIVSLALNGLILVLLVAGFIIHHHHKDHHGFAGRDGTEGRYGMVGARDFGPGFHHSGSMGWNRPDGFENDEGGGPGMRHGDFGMMGGERKGPPDPAMMTDRILNHLSAQLTLTDDQKAKIKPIIEAQVAQTEKEMETRRAARQKAMEDTKAKIRPLLNVDQQKQLDALNAPGGQPPQPDQKPAQ